MKRIKALFSRKAGDSALTYAMALVIFAVVFVLKSAGLLTNAISGQLVPICVYIVMAVSLNLTVGVLGELSLGHAGFMSVGAFSGVVVAASCQGIGSDPVRLILAVLVGGCLAGIVGFLIGIPVLRLRGDYLAIVTLAFGEIIRNIMNCLYVGIDSSGLHFSLTDAAGLHMSNGTLLINGPMGAVGISKISSFFAGFVLVMLTLVVVLNLVNSRTGRAVMAVRDNDIAAESVGIAITKYKLTAFVTSAVLAGMAGALYALNYSTIQAKKFDFNTSILVLVFVVLGGMGNIRGTILSTIVLYMLPELLREFSDYRMLLYAIILILAMIAKNNVYSKRFFAKVMESIRGAWRKIIQHFTRKKEAAE